MTWPQKSSKLRNRGAGCARRKQYEFDSRLITQNDAFNQSRALGLGETVQEARWVVFTTSVGTSVPAISIHSPLLAYDHLQALGYSPKNSIVITVLLFGALVAGAVFSHP